MQKILVTDSLFIFPEHEAQMRDAGFEVERLDKTHATEDELIQALQGKAGYIIGGTERATDKVLGSTTDLRAIAFTGADWRSFVPGFETAAQKGIKITNTPGTTTYAVTEYTLMLMLMMVRRVLELGRTGSATFITTNSVTDVQIGLFGMGRIGEHIARMLAHIGVRNIHYTNRTRKVELEAELGMVYCTPEELFATSDMISNHVSSAAGVCITKELLDTTKEDVIFINTGADSFDMDALYDRLKNHGARAAFDTPVSQDDDRYMGLPAHIWFSSNEGSAYNTHKTLQTSSDLATNSIINVLTSGTDQFVVN